MWSLSSPKSCWNIAWFCGQSKESRFNSEKELTVEWPYCVRNSFTRNTKLFILCPRAFVTCWHIESSCKLQSGSSEHPSRILVSASVFFTINKSNEFKFCRMTNSIIKFPKWLKQGTREYILFEKLSCRKVQENYLSRGGNGSKIRSSSF